ncbi:MAG: di-heme oxidoredictase family protein [Xanthomonadales bacterium]|nr:di-heme oxidoredictase family protein [Xanthomonadales bacterium]
MTTAMTRTILCKLVYCRRLGLLLTVLFAGLAAAAQVSAQPIGERPAVGTHLDQQDIEAGAYSLKKLQAAGQRLFDARFNTLDGQGRPESTGTGDPRAPGQPAFIRTSAPESNSCSGCHAQPRSGGAGDMVANVFVLAQALDPVTESVSAQFSNERNTLGMFGAGAIEMLAREMSDDLIAIREAASTQAIKSKAPVTVPLVTKGVSFGAVTVLPDGRIDPSAIEGVDWDLIVKPFHQKGAVVSLREFTNNAMNHHHGIQTVERFGANTDPDNDGVANELSVGDVTAITVMQAALPAPRPAHGQPARVERAIHSGEQTFVDIGCGRCHRAELILDTRHFSEPNPYNPPGNLQVEDVLRPFEFDLLVSSNSSLVKPAGPGRLIIKAFTDLKRHNLNDAELDHFDNEQLPQGTLAGFADASDFTQAPLPRPTGEFLTRKLWDVGNSDPYGHRGDLTTLTEAIWFHGGDARAERDAFFALPDQRQAAVIEFLKSMVVAE